MRLIRSRIERLEERSDTEQKKSLQVVVRAVGTTLALDSDTCIEILKECGFVASGISMLNLLNVPDGLNEAELKRYLRDHADEICGVGRPSVLIE